MIEKDKTRSVKIEGYGTFQIKPLEEAPSLLRDRSKYGDLVALFNPITEQWLHNSYMRFLRA